MRVVFCVSEAVPFAKTGGLADVCGALPCALGQLGVEVNIVLPKYLAVVESGQVLRRLDDDFDWSEVSENVRAYFLKNDMYLRQGLYGNRLGDFPDNLRRFSYLASKTLELSARKEWNPDIFHCHDWQTSLIPVLIDLLRKEKPLGKTQERPKTVLTIHNLAYQGIFSKDQMSATGLGWDYFRLEGLEYYDQINLLKGGIEFADSVNTVSPTYGSEVQTEEFGCGLSGVLKKRAANFSGIINGVDYKIWNPQGDGYLFKNYSADAPADKAVNKLELLRSCGLAQALELPLLGFVGRLVDQKGIDLIIEALPELFARGAQVVILGTGDPGYEATLKKMAKDNPKQLFVEVGFNDQLAHMIYAAADIFMMPSRFEPCGIGQLISFKYGTVPVVSRTGGLVDTVRDARRDRSKGNGFVFYPCSSRDFLGALDEAFEVYKDKRRWADMVRRLMRLNFSWKESARQYLALYEKVKRS